MTDAVRSGPPEATRGPALLRTLLAFVAAAVPLALVTGVFISHDVIPKAILLLTGAAAALFLLPHWGAGPAILWNNRRGRLFLILVAAQCVSLLLSTAASREFALAFSGVTWRRFGLVEQTAVLVLATAIVCAAAATPRWIGALLRGIVCCGATASLYGIFQYFGVDPFLDRKLYAIEYFGGIARPPATMGHALYFSAYLVPVLFLAMAAARRDSSPFWKRLHAAAAVFAATAIVLSATRSAILAGIAGSLLFAWRIYAAKGKVPSLRTALLPAGFLLTALLFILSPAGRNFRDRMHQWKNEGGGPRLQMWSECPALILQHPWLGTGPDTFAGEFRKAESLSLSRAYPDFYHETPHNALLDAGSAQGIPGMLILLGLFVLGWTRGSTDRYAESALQAGLDAALLGLFITSSFASLTPVTLLYLWFLAGLTTLIRQPIATPEPAWRPARLHFPAILLGTVFLLTASSLGMQDAAWAELGFAADHNNLPGAVKAYSSAVGYSLNMPGYELWASRKFATLGRALANTPDAAIAWSKASEAAALAEARGEERFNAAWQNAILGIASGDLVKGERETREAIRLAPNWHKPHLLLAQIMQSVNRNQEAAAEFQASIDRGWKR